MSETPVRLFEPVVGPGELILHLPNGSDATYCGQSMTPPRSWRPWGLAYRRYELEWVVSGLICSRCIGTLGLAAIPERMRQPRRSHLQAV